MRFAWATLVLAITAGAVSTAFGEGSQRVLWCEPRDGLSLGIEESSTPFIFVPEKGTNGPLISTGQDGSLRSNPGGHWSETAAVNVYITNTTDHIIWWSGPEIFDDAWSIKVFRPGMPEPQPWPMSRPAPPRPGPVPLKPGESKLLKFRLAGAGDVWPLIPAGDYTVTVTYAPDELLKYATGGEGNWTHPYDVPGFWKGNISTPELHIDVAYP